MDPNYTKKNSGIRVSYQYFDTKIKLEKTGIDWARCSYPNIDGLELQNIYFGHV